MKAWRTANVASRQRSSQSKQVNDNDQQTVYSEREEDVEWFEGVPVFYTAANEEEDRLFHLVHVGDAEAVASFVNETPSLDINCQNYHGYTALVQAIKNDDDAMVQVLLQFDNVLLGDAVLHAVEAGNRTLVAQLLDRMGELGQRFDNFAWDNSTDFSPDMGPLTVACHQNNYEMIRLLLCRGFRIDKPHPPNCFCDKKCINRRQGERLEDSIARLNAYKGLCSPAYLSLISSDPLYTASELAHELRTCADEEPEFEAEYQQLSENCEAFTVTLVDLCHTTSEVELLLNGPALIHSHWGRHSRRFVRVARAISYEQKKVLRTAWLEGWQDWPSMGAGGRLIRLGPYLVFLPLLAVLYLLAPNSRLTHGWKTPFNKFVSFAYSYVLFIAILFAQILLDLEKNHPAPPGTNLELVIVLYVLGLAWMNIKIVARMGLREYTRHYWNTYTAAMLTLFMMSFVCWAVVLWGGGERHVHRSEWSRWDPALVGEALFSFAVVLAFGRLIFLLQIGQHFGPLQMSLSRMLQDIAIFLVIFLIMLFSFASGLYYLYHKYDGEVRYEHGQKVAEQVKAFNTLPQSFYTLYWAIYGYSPPMYADIVLSNRSVKAGVDHRLTEVVGKAMFALYYVIGIIILINLLIAMTSNSFSNVWLNADTEWKFARTKVWMTFFDRGMTVPPPFNLIPSTKSVGRCLSATARVVCGCCAATDLKEEEQEYLDPDSTRRSSVQNPEAYAALMSQLMHRYFNKRRVHARSLQQTDLDGINLQVRKMRQVLIKIARQNNVLISSSTLTNSS